MQALQFEWAWQHPEKSKAVRDDVAALVASCKRAGLSGAKGKVGGQLPQSKDIYLDKLNDPVDPTNPGREDGTCVRMLQSAL